MFIVVCVAMWLLAVGLLSWFVLFFVLLFCLMDSVEYCDHQFGEEGTIFVCFSLVCGFSTVCHGVFALPLGDIGRLLSLIVAIPGHYWCYFCCTCVSMDSLGVQVSVCS